MEVFSHWHIATEQALELQCKDLYLKAFTLPGDPFKYNLIITVDQFTILQSATRQKK